MQKYSNQFDNTQRQKLVYPQEKPEHDTAANHFFTSLYKLASKQGVDVDLLLQEIGIKKSILHQPDIRIPTEKLSAFQKAIWDRLNDESMGVNSLPLLTGTYYMMGQLTVQQPNLKKALQLGARFYNFLTRREFISIKSDSLQTVLSINFESHERDYNHLFAEITLLSWHRYASWLIADVLPLNETRFPYQPPPQVGEYSYLFPGIHQFSSQDLAIVFPNQYLEREIKQNESSLKVFMKGCPLELFKQYRADYSLSTELKLIIKKELHSSIATIEYCSEQLHLTTRTLTRKLKGEGTSFQQIKDLVRRDKAVALLSQKSVKITEVAERIGFSDSSVFTRAFKHWTGETPRNFRLNLIDYEGLIIDKLDND